MKQILPGLLIFLIITPIVCAEICELKLEIGEESTCGNYKIRHDSWTAGDKNPYQIAHFHLWRLSPYADLGSDSIDSWYEIEGKYCDDDKLRVRHHGASYNPMRAKYALDDSPPQLIVRGHLYSKDMNLNWAPVKWATAYLCDYDYSDDSYDCLTDAVLTNETGYFKFNSVENVDWDEDGGKLDISVQFIAGSHTGCVRNATDETYDYRTDPYPDASTGGLAMTTRLPSNKEAWWVYDTLCQGWKYLSDKAGYRMDGVVVYWQWGHDADFLEWGIIDTTHAIP